MLFKFGTFWKTIAILTATWVTYGIWDFEFVVVTLLALILALKMRN